MKSRAVQRVDLTQKCWLNRKQQHQRCRAVPSAFWGGLKIPAVKWMLGQSRCLCSHYASTSSTHLNTCGCLLLQGNQIWCLFHPDPLYNPMFSWVLSNVTSHFPLYSNLPEPQMDYSYHVPFLLLGPKLKGTLYFLVLVFYLNLVFGLKYRYC